MNQNAVRTASKRAGNRLGPVSSPDPRWHHIREKWITAVAEVGDRRPLARFIREFNQGRPA